MPIRKLPALLVNQIAAGEVIERPASVVKELVENALDAGATRIDVAVDAGGRERIRVRDDGNGIPPDELTLAVTPHATSKLRRAEELAAIATLGFRGEALASVASVSRMQLTSRTRDRDEGGTIEIAADQVQPVRPAAGAPGTTVEVRDLFFNIPARRKFLRTVATEFAHINDVVTRLAMAHPPVGFRLAHQGRQIIDTLPAEERQPRCVALLGQDLAEALLTVESCAPDATRDRQSDLRIWGLVGLPSIARASGRHLYLSVNGRAIKDRQIVHAVREAYRGLMPPDKFPVAVIAIEMDPAEVDVNVHPTKAEVRFRNPSAVHGRVLATVRERLLDADLTPTPMHTTMFVRSASTPPSEAGRDGPPVDGRNAGFDYALMKAALESEAHDVPQAPDASLGPPDERRSILQVHNSYLVAEDEQGILIIDQHALHERVMFETLKQRVLGQRALESQRLLMPEVIEASPEQQALLGQIESLLSRIGVEAVAFGARQVAIQAFPTFLFSRQVAAGPFLSELLDKIEAGVIEVRDPTAEEAALHEVLDMMACKAAVKAGDRLSEAELSTLLAQRETVERGSACPHGRPTSIRISLRELEKQFGRT